nr:hypothetical protein [Micromonospora sp. DSM 115978]
MLRVPPARSLVAVCVLALVACGTPPELRDRPGSSVPPPGTPSPLATSATPTQPAAPTQPPKRAAPTGFGETIAVPCAGRPSGQQVVSLLRDTDGVLPSGARITTVTAGPFCAGTWQYTVVSVKSERGQGPLQVVTNGPPDDLNMITAGTDVCSVPVRATAPYGIRTIACNGILPPTGQPTGFGP